MATNDMSIEERYQYLSRMQSRYQQADRETKQKLLDEMVAYIFSFDTSAQLLWNVS